jgi:hypothetical protein
MFHKSLSKLVIAKSAVLLSLQLTSFGQSPGGLDPKFAQDIQRDVATFVQGAAGQSQQATLQNQLIGLIERTGTDTRTLQQIVSESINSASTTPGHTLEKVARVVQVATYSAASSALANETANAPDVIEGIADTITFQFVSLSAKGDSKPTKQLSLVTQAIAFGIGVAVLDNAVSNAAELTQRIGKGALSGTYKAARIHNMDSSMATAYSSQGLASGIIQLSVVRKADVVSRCKAISRGSFDGIISQSGIKADQANLAGASTVRGLLDGAISAKSIYKNAKQKLDGETLASIAISTFEGVKDSLSAGPPSNLDAFSLRSAAFNEWSASMIKIIPDVDNVAQERMVVSLYANSLGVPELQQNITAGIINELVSKEAGNRARELYPVMTEGATTAVYENNNGEITHDAYHPFVQTAVQLYVQKLGGEESKENTIYNVFNSLLDGAIRSIVHEQKLLLRNTARISEILARSAVQSSDLLSIDTNLFLKGAAGGLSSAAMTSAVSKDLALQSPEILVQGTVEGMQVGFTIGLMVKSYTANQIADVLKDSSIAAGSSTIEIGRRIQMNANQLSHFAEGVSEGATSGIAKLLNKQPVSKTLGSGAGKLIEQAAYGLAMGAFTTLVADITQTNLNRDELVNLAEAISYGAGYGAVVNGPLVKAPELAQSSASGSVLGTISVAAPMFEKQGIQGELNNITLSACKGAAEGTVTAAAKKNLDLKAIARSAAYGGTSSATLAAIATSQPPEIIAEVAKYAARGMVQGTMEATYSKVAGGSN